ncbi:MAG: hypothetical protein Ct9H300mP6_01310 [Gammaproteobacteria bacterium]|nr:MAG: hypothetical protein Ct9H300mP6_01310 [Gammaproteobacteria bacterium]
MRSLILSLVIPLVDKEELTQDEIMKLYYEPDIALYSKDSGQSAINPKFLKTAKDI